MSAAAYANVSRLEENSLHYLFKTSTRAAHDRAEKSPFMNALIRRRLALDAYKIFLGNLYKLYDAMEAELDLLKDHPVVGPVYFPDHLNRRESLESDLEHFHGPHWKSELKVDPVTQEYIDYIKQIAGIHPEFLLCHAYVRYLGDLSGGQVIKRQIAKAYGLKDDSGVQFYLFPNVTDVPAFKQFYSGRLNSLEIDEDMKNKLVQETSKAFDFNVRIFDAMHVITSAIPGGYLVMADDADDKAGQEQKIPETPTDIVPNPVLLQTAKTAYLQVDDDKMFMKFAFSFFLATFVAVMVMYCPWCARMLKSFM